MTDWAPATDAETAMRDALLDGDQERYFAVLAGMTVLLPTPPEVPGDPAPVGWATWNSGGRTHVLAFTSPGAMHSCLPRHGGGARITTFAELAGGWPNRDWWLAVNPGLPIEGYLPSWFVAQVARGDTRVPGAVGARPRTITPIGRARVGGGPEPTNRSSADESSATAYSGRRSRGADNGYADRPDRTRSGDAAEGPGELPAALLSHQQSVASAQPHQAPLTARAWRQEPVSPPPASWREGVPEEDVREVRQEPVSPAPASWREGVPERDVREVYREPVGAAPPESGQVDRGEDASGGAEAGSGATAQRPESPRRGAIRAAGQMWRRGRNPAPVGPAQPGAESAMGSDRQAMEYDRQAAEPDDRPVPTAYGDRGPDPEARGAWSGDDEGAWSGDDAWDDVWSPTERPARADLEADLAGAGPGGDRQDLEARANEADPSAAGRPGSAARAADPGVRGDLQEGTREEDSGRARGRALVPGALPPGTTLVAENLQPLTSTPEPATYRGGVAREHSAAGRGQDDPQDFHVSSSDRALLEESGGGWQPGVWAGDGSGWADDEESAETGWADHDRPLADDGSVSAQPAATARSDDDDRFHDAEARSGDAEPSSRDADGRPALADPLPPESGVRSDAAGARSDDMGPRSDEADLWQVDVVDDDEAQFAAAGYGLAAPRARDDSPADRGSANWRDGDPIGRESAGVRSNTTGPDDFSPAGDTEATLLEAASAGRTDSFLSTLLLATVLLPVAPGASADARPGDPGFRWPQQPIDDQPFVTAFTSRERLVERLGDVASVPVRFMRLIRHWPQEAWTLTVNPATPIGAVLPGAQIRGLATWAADVGLDGDDTGPVEAVLQPVPDPRGQESPAQRPVVMQKPIPPTQVAYYLERGYDRVSGFVHRAAEVGHLSAPRRIVAALGLGYPGSPFSADDAELYVLSWAARCEGLYRLPYGGQSEAAMRAMEGWVIERAPFRGNGFAPSDSGDVIAEFKVDSVRLPHGAEIWRMTEDREPELVAMLDADVSRWIPVGKS